MRNRGGFTIVETLLVLGVTGIIFFATMLTISGRQGRIEFMQSMREIDARVRDTLNDVNDGFYPSIPNLRCSAPGANGKPNLSYDAATSDTTGKNGDCVLAGKVIQIGTDDDVSDVKIYSLAGRRTTQVGARVVDVSTIEELNPVVINVTSAGNTLDATDRSSLPSGIKLIQNDSTSDSYAVIGIYYNNFGGQNAGGQSTGAASVSIVNLTAAAHTEGAVMAKAENVNSGDFLPADGALVLCFKSGTSKQFATLTLRGASGGFTTELKVDVPASGLAACI